MNFTLLQSRFKFFAFFLFMTILCGSADAQVRKTNNKISTNKPLITAGQSVGQLKIGDDIARVFQLYPKLPRSSHAPTKDCDFSYVFLPDSIILAIKNERIVQITVKSNYPNTTPQTADQIHTESSAAVVKKAYPNANKALTKLSETFTATGYEPLIYWIDKSAGIAFEFYTDSSRGRLVNAVHIFAPNGQFLFNDGCDKNEDLRDLPSFAIKVPEKMIRDYQQQ